MAEENRVEYEAGALFAIVPEDRRHPEDPGFYIDNYYNVFYDCFIVGKIPEIYQSESGITYKPEKITAIRLVEKGIMRVAEYDYVFVNNQ